MNKNKKMLLTLVTGVSVLTLAACSNDKEESKGKDGEVEKASKLSAQEQTQKALEQIVASKSMSADVEFDYTLDKDALTKAGLTEEEITELENTIKSNNFDMSFAINENIIEIIIKIDAGEVMELEGVENVVEIPVVIDIKNNKTYMGTDWFVDLTELMLMEGMKSLPEEDKAEFEESLKEFETVKANHKQGKLIDINEASEEGFFASQEDSFAGLAVNDLIDLENTDIKVVLDLLKDINKDAFVLNDDKTVTFSLPNDKIEQFEENIGLIESVNETPAEEALSFSSDIEVLANGYHDSIKDVQITTLLDNKNKLKEFTVITKNTINDSYITEKNVYKNLVLDGNIKTKYSLDNLNLMTAEEELKMTEDLSAYLMVAMITLMTASMSESEDTTEIE